MITYIDNTVRYSKQMQASAEVLAAIPASRDAFRLAPCCRRMCPHAKLPSWHAPTPPSAPEGGTAPSAPCTHAPPAPAHGQCVSSDSQRPRFPRPLRCQYTVGIRTAIGQHAYSVQYCRKTRHIIVDLHAYGFASRQCAALAFKHLACPDLTLFVQPQ